MRRIWILLLVCAFVGVNAQKKYVKKAQGFIDSDPKQIDTAWTLIEIAKENAESKDMPKTWLVRGKVCQAIGMSKDAHSLSLCNQPFEQALESLKKGYELDQTASMKSDLDDALFNLADSVYKLAIDEYSASNYSKSLEYFELVLKIKEQPAYIGMVDTSTIYNAGMVANYAKNYEKAKMYLKKAYDYNYKDISVYAQLSDAYLSLKDSLNALNILKDGYSKFPENDYMLQTLAIFYVNTGNAKEAKLLLDKAKAKSPNNDLIYYAEAIMYTKINDVDNAEKAYKSAIGLKPESFNYNFSCGVMFYNQAVDLIKSSNTVDASDTGKYNGILRKAEVSLEKARPYLEKANMIDAGHNDTMVVLKEIYFRLRNKNKEYLDKYKAMKAKLENK